MEEDPEGVLWRHPESADNTNPPPPPPPNPERTGLGDLHRPLPWCSFEQIATFSWVERNYDYLFLSVFLHLLGCQFTTLELVESHSTFHLVGSVFLLEVLLPRPYDSRLQVILPPSETSFRRRLLYVSQSIVGKPCVETHYSSQRRREKRKGGRERRREKRKTLNQTKVWLHL